MRAARLLQQAVNLNKWFPLPQALPGFNFGARRNGAAMQRILITSLSVHWTIMFGLAAFQISASATGVLAAAALAGAHALVAMLFLWLAVSVWGRASGEGDEIARSAFAGAVLVLAAATLAGDAPLTMAASATQLAALGVTYLIVRDEEAAFAGGQPGTKQLSGAFARRLALAAAHGAMLTRLSKRDAPTDRDI